jgi:hypothetical protein
MKAPIKLMIPVAGLAAVAIIAIKTSEPSKPLPQPQPHHETVKPAPPKPPAPTPHVAPRPAPPK